MIAETGTALSGARIDSVTISRVGVPIEPPMISGAHYIASIDCNVVEINSGGETGVGYSFAFFPLEADSVTPLIRHLAAGLPGSPVSVLRDFGGEAWKRINFVGRAGPAVMALSAIDVALWDLNARHLGVSLAESLGGVPAPATLYGAGGWLSFSEEELVDEALDFRRKGFSGYKMRAGSDDWRDDVRRAALVRDAIGDEMDLMLDANQAWSVETAKEAAAALEPLRLAWLEEPVDCHDYSGLAAVRREAPMPIAAGETVYGSEPFRQMAELDSLDVLQPDLMRCGGISGFLEIVAQAPADARICPHLFTEIAAQLVPVAGNGPVEYLPSWFSHLFDGVPEVVDGTLAPHHGKGLGISLSEECRERWQVARFEL